jgi:hypothetical protein
MLSREVVVDQQRGAADPRFKLPTGELEPLIPDEPGLGTEIQVAAPDQPVAVAEPHQPLGDQRRSLERETTRLVVHSVPVQVQVDFGETGEIAEAIALQRAEIACTNALAAVRGLERYQATDVGRGHPLAAGPALLDEPRIDSRKNRSAAPPPVPTAGSVITRAPAGSRAVRAGGSRGRSRRPPRL